VKSVTLLLVEDNLGDIRLTKEALKGATIEIKNVYGKVNHGTSDVA
jgi:hypothetical protein